MAYGGLTTAPDTSPPTTGGYQGVSSPAFEPNQPSQPQNPGILGTIGNAIGSYANALGSGFSQAGQDIAQGYQMSQTGPTSSTYEQASGLAKGAVSAAFHGTADILNGIFYPISTAIGEALKVTGAQTLMDKTGQIIADASGITDWPAFQKFAETHPNAEKDWNDLVTLGLTFAGGAKVSELPKTSLEDAKAFASKIIPEKAPIPTEENPVVPVAGEVKPTVTQGYQGVGPTTETTPQIVIPEQAPNSRAQTIQEAGKTKGLDINTETSTHEKINMAEQEKSARSFVEQNPTEAMKVVMGDLKKEGPSPESIYTAMETKAFKEGDVKTLQQLSKSKIPTVAGQALKALDSSDPNSPVSIMRDIRQTREEALLKRTGKNIQQSTQDVVKEIKQEVQKNSSKRQSWDEFVKEIQCK